MRATEHDTSRDCSRVGVQQTERTQRGRALRQLPRVAGLVALGLIAHVALLSAQTRGGVGVRLSADDRLPVPVSRSLPSRPAAGGPSVVAPVDVEIAVAPSGDVIDARVVNPADSMADQQASDAARRWRFRPSSERLATLAVLTFTYGAGGVSAHLHAVAHEPLPPPTVPIEAAPPPSPGVVWGAVVRQVAPEYTPDARDRKINGKVLLDVIVMPDGSVGQVRMLTPLVPDYGLNREAEIAARYYLVEPCRRGGEPIACHVVLEFTFRIF